MQTGLTSKVTGCMRMDVCAWMYAHMDVCAWMYAHGCMRMDVCVWMYAYVPNQYILPVQDPSSVVIPAMQY